MNYEIKQVKTKQITGGWVEQTSSFCASFWQ